MIDEILCLEMREGKKTISIAKLCARLTYLILGSASGIGGRYIVNHVIKK